MLEIFHLAICGSKSRDRRCLRHRRRLL